MTARMWMLVLTAAVIVAESAICWFTIDPFGASYRAGVMFAVAFAVMLLAAVKAQRRTST